MGITNVELAQASIAFFGGFCCLMVYIIIKINMIKRESMTILGRMFPVTALSLVFDACAYLFRGNTDAFSLGMTRLSNGAVFFINYLLVVLFIRYVYAVIEENQGKPKPWVKYVGYVALGLATCILIINRYTGWMYYFDEGNYYHRSYMWYFYTAGSFICIFMGAFLCWRHRKDISKGTRNAILCFAAMPEIAVLIQICFYGISVSSIGVTLGIVLMLFTNLNDWRNAKVDSGEKEKISRRNKETMLLFFIMVISMSASIISCLVSIRRISAVNSEQSSQTVAHMVNDRLEKEFLRPIVVAETMSKDYSLQKLLMKSGDFSARDAEAGMVSYLHSIQNGFGYQMAFAASDKSRAYYTYNGIAKYLDVIHDPHDIWYAEYLKAGKEYLLNVDTDEANNWNLSVFVNMGVWDEKGKFLGICGVGVEMTQLQEIIQSLEDAYGIHITLMDQHGVIQVDVSKDSLDETYFQEDELGALDLSQVSSTVFTYELGKNKSRLVKYVDSLGWYLVIEDVHPDKIDVQTITIPSIIIFAIGLVMLGLAFAVMSIRERRTRVALEKNRLEKVTDELTGLLNRRAYDELCDQIAETHTEHKQTIVMMDVNGLKRANDEIGHSAGDELIIGAADTIRQAFEAYGTCYRTGGDEFIAILTCTEEKVQEALAAFEEAQSSWHGQQIEELTISKGVVIGAQCDAQFTWKEMTELADQRMYRDKDAYYQRTGKERRKGR